MSEEPVYNFIVMSARCERCSRRPAYVVEERSDGRRSFLCKTHLEPWIEERRWAVVRMGSPIGECPEATVRAIEEDLYRNGVRVIYADDDHA